MADDDSGPCGRGVKAPNWSKIGTALERAASGLPAGGQGTIDRWVAALAGRLALDALEACILGWRCTIGSINAPKG